MLIKALLFQGLFWRAWMLIIYRQLALIVILHFATAGINLIDLIALFVLQWTVIIFLCAKRNVYSLPYLHNQ